MLEFQCLESQLLDPRTIQPQNVGIRASNRTGASNPYALGAVFGVCSVWVDESGPRMCQLSGVFPDSLLEAGAVCFRNTSSDIFWEGLFDRPPGCKNHGSGQWISLF